MMYNVRKHLLLMKKLLSFLVIAVLAICLIGPAKADNPYYGKFLLQTQGKGEVWYVNPYDGKRYQMPNDAERAYRLLASLSTVIDGRIILRIPAGPGGDKGDLRARELYKGHILAPQDDATRLWYVHTEDMKRYWFDGTDASFRYLLKKALGATDAQLASIPVGETAIEEPVARPETIQPSVESVTGTIQGLPALPGSAILNVAVATDTRAIYDDSSEPRPTIKVTFDKPVKDLVVTVWDTTASSTQVWTQAYPFEMEEGQLTFTLSVSNVQDGMGYIYSVTATDKETGEPIKYDGSFQL